MADIIQVLYVDDEPGLLCIAKLYLEKEKKLAVDTVTSPAVALDHLNTKEYDAIISDYQMPDMDGIAFLKHLKVSGNTTPFIIFTGKGREEVVIEALNEGADFYLQKGGEPKAQFAELSNKIHYAVTRRHAEDALHETTEYLQNLFFYANAPIITWGPDYRITRFNPAFEHLTGRSEVDVHGKTLDILFPDKTRNGSLTLINKALNGERWETVEIPILTKDGTIRTVIWNSANILDPNGRIVSTIAQGVDITERKHAEEELLRKHEELNALYEEITATEEELRSNYSELTWKEQALKESEGKFHSLYMHMIEGAALHELMYNDQGVPVDYSIIETNPAFERHLGISRDNVIGKTSREAYGVDEPPYLDIYSRVALTGDPEAFHTYFPPMDKHFSISAYCPVKGKFATIFEDITERKQAELALERAQEKYTKAFIASPDAIMISDMETGKFIEMNDVTSQIYGYSRDEMIGKTALELGIWLRKEDRDTIINQVSTKGRVERHELLERRKSGKIFNASISADTIILADRVHLISVVRDITERKQAEEALRQINKKLNLLSGITRHDIKNQLFALKGYLELSDLSVGDPEKVSRFIGEGQKIADIIEQQINITKDYENIGVNAPIWQNIGSVFKAVIEQQKLPGITMREQAGYFEVLADPLLERVFFNLIDNTWRHGGPVSCVSLSSTVIEDDLVIVYEDDGQGIPKTDKTHIFDHGFGKNTGLGLFLSCQILSITGITVKETGEPGKGARFEMVVPKGMFR